MPRPIVIEGPDGAGKSTLCKQLGQVLPHRPTTTGGASKSSVELLDRVNQIEKGPDYSLYDRCSHISDMVYRTALGKRPFIHPEYMFDRLRKWNPVIVFCSLSNSRTMLNNMIRTKKAHKPADYMLQVEKNHMEIVRCYDLVMKDLQDRGFTVNRYDWQKNNFDALASTILAESMSCAD